ncbi:MAG: AAA family ATPase [Microscillaceae bacterium]|nr:AAA family ATPase [Microscillaceae bacterium]
MAYKSHIRDSKIRNLFERVRSKKYKNYLSSIIIENLRVFKEVEIRFDFPITALIGSNGSGKTTLLTASACTYKDVKPSDFFTKSSLDSGLKNAKIRSVLFDRPDNKDEVNGLISYRQARWDRKKTYKRQVKYFGIKRTLPPAEQKELAQLRSKKILPTSQITLNAEEVKIIQRILGVDCGYEYYEFGKNDLLVATNNLNISYSEFHFGAGESSIARLVYAMERLDDYALVLIEEIENGLHPSAIVRLIEYLFEVCERKKHQIIFTTHSDYAIQLLPNEAVWYCHHGTVSQGKVNIEALRVLIGDVEKQLVIFTEDKFAEIFITTILRHSGFTDILSLTEIHATGGKDTVKRFVDTQNENPATKHLPAIGILDGDVPQSEIDKSKFKECYIKLPGDMPEKEVWDYLIREKLEEAIARITLKLGMRIEQQNLVKDKILETNREVMDFHLLYAVLGEKLGFLPESVVENAFITAYVDYKNGELIFLTDFIQKHLEGKKI